MEAATFNNSYQNLIKIPRQLLEIFAEFAEGGNNQKKDGMEIENTELNSNLVKRMTRISAED